MGLIGKKARRDAERQQAARRRDTLLRILSLTVPLLTGWRYGLDAAKGKVEKQEDVINITKDVVSEVLALPIKERRFIAMHLTLVEKARLDLVEELGIRGEIARRGSMFFQSLHDDLNALSDELLDQNERYGLMTKLDDMKSLTYLVFMALCDWGNNEVAAGRNPPKSFENLVGRFRGLANHLVEEDNIPLRQSVSNAYWNTRHEMQGRPESWWDDNDPDVWCVSAEELRRTAEKLRKELAKDGQNMRPDAELNAITFAQSAKSAGLTEVTECQQL